MPPWRKWKTAEHIGDIAIEVCGPQAAGGREEVHNIGRGGKRGVLNVQGLELRADGEIGDSAVAVDGVSVGPGFVGRKKERAGTDDAVVAALLLVLRNQVGVEGASARSVDIVAVCIDRERRAADMAELAIHLEAAHNCARDAMVRELLTGAEGQAVDAPKMNRFRDHSQR